MTHNVAPATSDNKTTTALLGSAIAAAGLLSALLLVQGNSLVLPADVATYLHEATHDARHALGVPCH